MPGWEPYTQILTGGGAAGVIDGYQLGYGCSYTVRSWGGLDRPDISLDGGARACAWRHATVGAGGFDEYIDVCAAIVPGSDYGSTGSSLRAGVIPTVFLEALVTRYEVIAYQAEISRRADRTITANGLESWADPAVRPPPATEVIGGRTVNWTYAPFTELTGVISFADGSAGPETSNGVEDRGTGFMVAARQVPYVSSPPGWDPDASGAPRFALEVAAGGAVTAVGQQDLTDLMSGYTWRLSASTAEGVTGDAGRPPPPSGSVAQYASLVLNITYYRVGMRRSGVAPPLHQRRRTDGLGGGPMHQSPGLASRQVGGFARGIY